MVNALSPSATGWQREIHTSGRFKMNEIEKEWNLLRDEKDQIQMLEEIKALRKLRMAVGKMIRHINQGNEHPKDLQQVKLFLSEAEKVESPVIFALVRDHFNV